MKVDAAVLGAVPRRDVDVLKLSTRVEAGHVIETVSGRRYLVASKIAGKDGVVFHLSTPTESLSVTAQQLVDLEPLPSGVSRLASVLRLYAFNKLFDRAVKDAVERYDLPVDEGMDWAKWFEAVFTPYLREYMLSKGMKPNSEIIDEAIHAIIADSLYFRDGLAKFPKPDRKRLKKEKGYKADIARQVTKFLSNLFDYEKTKAKREIIRMTNVVPHFEHGGEQGQGMAVPMEQPSESGEEQNILETEEHAHPSHELPSGAAAEAESWEDISRFRKDYADWLEMNESEATTRLVLKLFDIIIKGEHEGEREYLSQYRDAWMEQTGKSLSYYGIIMSKLASTLEDFVVENPELAELSSIARLIADIKSKKQTTKRTREKPVAASLSLAAAAPSDVATIPGDTGRIPHDDIRGTSDDAVILVDQPEEEPQRSVMPEVPAVRHGI